MMNPARILVAVPALAFARAAAAASHSGTDPNAPGSLVGTLVLAAGVGILCVMLVRLLARWPAPRV